MVQVESDSLNEEDNVVLSKLFRRMHEPKPVACHLPSSPRPSTTPTPGMVPPSNDVPSLVRTTDNPGVTVGDTTADPRSEIPSPIVTSTQSVSPGDIHASIYPH